MRIAYHVLAGPAPLGLLFAARTDRGLRYLEYMDRRSLKRMIALRAAENPGATWEPSVRELRPLAEQLEQYFCGTLRHLRVPLDPVGSPFQLSVWNALHEIAYGETRSYGEIAKAAGDPKAVRAVGLAIHQNPLVIVTPCHRVIGADGKLVGYSGGLPRKKFLLALEARFRNMQDLEGDRVIEQLAVKVKRPLAPARPAKRRRAPRPAAAARPAGMPRRVTAARPLAASRPGGASKSAGVAKPAATPRPPAAAKVAAAPKPAAAARAAAPARGLAPPPARTRRG